MAHIGRTVKNVEAPRPLKSQSRSSLKTNYMLIEELIQLIENVALTLQSGINNTEPMSSLVQNLRIHGPQLESVSKDTLDRAFVVFRNASQDERLNIMTRLNLLELIELRAKGWEDNGFNSYYKTKQATNVEIPDAHHQHHQTEATQASFLSTSPTFGAGSAAMAAAMAAVGSGQQQLLLGPGELIRNSGKFPKPTKIPGKTYCKDEVVIRNADSGKVMGIKGRRVHMIEELSETIISFQRVNPGAKERLVQITGPSEEKINYAKQLIEDTIRRNASPVRLDPSLGAHTGGSCSSLASSNSDEATSRPIASGGNLANRLSLNSAQNFMTATAAAQQVAAQQQAAVVALMSSSTPNAINNAAGKVMRPNQQMLLHSFSTNDASLGEYKYTVNVGQHLIKITGDCCDLVRVAKLVLDDYFSSAEFLASVEAGAAFDGSMVSPNSTPSTPLGPPQFIMGTSLQMPPPLADSGVGLNYMAGQISNNINEGDDDVFVDTNGLASSQNNGLARSRRSHFSRKDSTPESGTQNTVTYFKSESGASVGNKNADSTARIIHEYEHLIYYAKSPHAWALPVDWQKICEKFPAIIRNKVTHARSNTTAVFCNPATIASTIVNTSHDFINHLNNNLNNATIPTVTTNTPATDNSSLNRVLSDELYKLNIKREGYFGRQSCSATEVKYSVGKSQKPHHQETNVGIVKPTTSGMQWSTEHQYPALVSNTLGSHINTNLTAIKDNSHKNLLVKQIKFISSIMENSNRKLEYSEYSLHQHDPIIIDDSDDETETARIRLNRNVQSIPQYKRVIRSNSTCD